MNNSGLFRGVHPDFSLLTPWMEEAARLRQKTEDCWKECQESQDLLRQVLAAWTSNAEEKEKLHSLQSQKMEEEVQRERRESELRILRAIQAVREEVQLASLDLQTVWDEKMMQLQQEWKHHLWANFWRGAWNWIQQLVRR